MLERTRFITCMQFRVPIRCQSVPQEQLVRTNLFESFVSIVNHGPSLGSFSDSHWLQEVGSMGQQLHNLHNIQHTHWLYTVCSIQQHSQGTTVAHVPPSGDRVNGSSVSNSQRAVFTLLLTKETEVPPSLFLSAECVVREQRAVPTPLPRGRLGSVP